MRDRARDHESAPRGARDAFCSNCGLARHLACPRVGRGAIGAGDSNELCEHEGCPCQSARVRNNGPFQSCLRRASGVIGITCRPSDPVTRDPRSSSVSSSSRPRQLPGTPLHSCSAVDLHCITLPQLPEHDHTAPADTVLRRRIASSGLRRGIRGRSRAH